jgi:hypothetical protein
MTRPQAALPPLKFNQNPSISQNYPKPTPMSISTRNSHLQPRYNAQRSAPNRFKNDFSKLPPYVAEELFNIHAEENYDVEYPHEYDDHADQSTEENDIPEQTDFLGEIASDDNIPT